MFQNRRWEYKTKGCNLTFLCQLEQFYLKHIFGNLTIQEQRWTYNEHWTRYLDDSRIPNIVWIRTCFAIKSLEKLSNI